MPVNNSRDAMPCLKSCYFIVMIIMGLYRNRDSTKLADCFHLFDVHKISKFCMQRTFILQANFDLRSFRNLFVL